MTMLSAAQAPASLTYGTAIALGPYGALLRGNSGSGKSDLALRFLTLPQEDGAPARLVADDQVRLEAADGKLIASAPKTLQGLMEIRGLGISPMPTIPQAQIVLVCDLVSADNVPRLPPEPLAQTRLAGADIPVLRLAPFEASAPVKLKMAILHASRLLGASEQ